MRGGGGGGGGGGGNSRVTAQVPPPAGRCVIIGTMRAESMHARDENIYMYEKHSCITLIIAAVILHIAFH